LKILITNTCLDGYTGSEVVVRDLALELQRQGLIPLVYAQRLGLPAEELKSHGVEVTDDLQNLSTVPDVIHGHHHAQVIEALLHFPGVPAVYVCHSADWENDEPFYFPRILRYVAVDNRCRARLESASDIPEDRIEVILNAVDLQRFQPRKALPARPQRALVFSNYASRYTHLPAVRRACRGAGLELDVMGALAGTCRAHPETVLPRYDLVFAKARCALEAMATGSAVVLCDFAGAGPMVTSEDFDRLRSLNFGAGVLLHPLRSETIGREIAHYDPVDAAEVAHRVREQAGLEMAALRWHHLYMEVVEELRQSPPNCEAELRATAAYLRKWSYAKGGEPARNIMKRIRQIPAVGNDLAHFARKILRRWAGG
jgi:glycosyltransferase involved in cell wall biosynthesis